LKKAVPLSRYLVFFGLAVAICALDLVTKSWIFDWLGMPEPPREPWWLWDRVAGFQTNLNEGALFGMGQGLWLPFSVFALAAAIGIVVWMFWGGAARDRLLTVALGLVTAGIFGNLYDRLGLPGLTWRHTFGCHAAGDPVHAVRDFILVKFGDWSWPTFNIADSALVCGAMLLAWHAFFGACETVACDPQGPASRA
jgi:signal peptidase II